MIGRYLMLDMPDDYWTLSRFEHRLTKHLYLVQALNPSTGEPNMCGSYVYASVTAFLAWVDEPEPEKVVQLVKH
jgi:hypothetical protein